MKRVEAKGNNWSLFSPNTNQDLLTLYGEEFEQAYLKAEESGQAVSVISADELRMAGTLPVSKTRLTSVVCN